MISTSNFWKKSNKVFLYSSSVIFKNYKSYLYSLLLPLIIVFFVYAIQSNFFEAQIDPNIFPLLFIIPSVILIVFFSKILLDWRKSVFIKEMKNFGVSKYSFVFGFTLTTFLCSLMSSMFCIVCIYLFSLISRASENSFYAWSEYVTSGTQIIGLVLGLILSSIISSLVSILFTGYLRNIYVIQTVNVVLIIFFLLFSDILLKPGDNAKVFAICVIGYFDPYRYVSWITLMFNGRMYINFFYVYFFAPVMDGYISFTAIWQPIIGALGYIGLIGALSTVLFSSSTKR